MRMRACVRRLDLRDAAGRTHGRQTLTGPHRQTAMQQRLTLMFAADDTPLLYRLRGGVPNGGAERGRLPLFGVPSRIDNVDLWPALGAAPHHVAFRTATVAKLKL